jgi:hypothetical protein
MANEPGWDGIPQFYKDPLPASRKELRLLHRTLIERLSTSMSSSRDNELAKEKIAEILSVLERKWTPKDYIFLTIGIAGIVASVAGFLF